MPKSTPQRTAAAKKHLIHSLDPATTFSWKSTGGINMAAYSKTILVLANSRKISGRCVAGKELVGTGFGGWIRPVSLRPAGELSEADRQFQDGTDPKLLDVVEIPMSRHLPHGF